MSENNIENSTSNRIITLSYTEDELNKIINIIAQLPYASSFSIIHNIQAQAQAQIQSE